MSTIRGIFEPFKKYVQNQLRLRRRILSSKNIGVGALPQEFFTYNSKQCIIRMASGVDLKGDTENPNPILDTYSSDAEVAAFESGLHGANCARNWVLESGIIDINKRVFKEFTEEEQEAQRVKEIEEAGDSYSHAYQGTTFATSDGNIYSPKEVFNNELWTQAIKGQIEWVTTKDLPNVTVGFKSDKERAHRGGVGDSGAYGDPKIRADRDANDTYGMVPMPGITDANIRTKSDDGSLREAQVNFTCHNRRQLEILEALYMRPGYPIILQVIMMVL